MTLLLVAGIGVILAGLAAILFGIPVKEFGFGNTLILTGTVGACTGMIMVSLAVVLRELKALAPRLPAADMPAAPRPRREALPAEPTEADAEDATPPPAAPDALFSRDQPAVERAAASDAAPPWQHDAARERARPAADEPATPAEPKRRNLLFQSSLRKERERVAMDPAAQDPAAEPAGDAPPFSFEDAWPQIERTRPDAPARARPSTFRDAPAPADPAAAAPHSEPAGVTVLKSGVVDGMAYSLYSDGSIEAQMPEGMMRFASIDELREHLDQRG